MHLIDTPICVPHCGLLDLSLIEFFSRTKYSIVVILWLPLSLLWTVRGVTRDYTQLNPTWGSRFDAYLYYPNMNWIFQNYPAAMSPSMASCIPRRRHRCEGHRRRPVPTHGRSQRPQPALRTGLLPLWGLGCGRSWST